MGGTSVDAGGKRADRIRLAMDGRKPNKMAS